MSWSITCSSAKRDDAKASIERQLADIPTLDGPAQDLKDRAGALVLAAIAAQSADNLISVGARSSTTKRSDGTTSEAIHVSVVGTLPMP